MNGTTRRAVRGRARKAPKKVELAVVAFYRPKPDSANDDRFELEVSFADGRKLIQRFRVIISNGANEGQRI